MPAGKARYAKDAREDYIFNRPAPAIASLPRATEDLVIAYRIFSPGLDTVTKLDQIAADVSYGIENGTCGDLMQNLGISSSSKLQELYKKSYSLYVAEIKRMDEEEDAEATRFAKELAAREVREQALGGETTPSDCSNKDTGEDRNTFEQQKVNSNNDSTNRKKRHTDDEPSTPCFIKRVRHYSVDDKIPDPYWLSKDEAQTVLETMSVRVGNLEATLTRLQNFYHDNFVNADSIPNPTISAPLARADTQIRQDAVWYVEELQRIMAGASSSELGIVAGWEWKRDRFDNAEVRGLIERIREFNARLVHTEKEMDGADRLREDFMQEFAKSSAMEATGEMFLEDWAKQLLRVTNILAHEARQYVSFRTMEAEWAEKWAHPGDREGVADGSSPIVIDSSSSNSGSDDDDSLVDDSEDEKEDSDTR